MNRNVVMSVREGRRAVNVSNKVKGWFNLTLSLLSCVRILFEDYEPGMEKSVHVRIIASWIHIRGGRKRERTTGT